MALGDKRAQSGGHFGLELDHQFAGWVVSAEGGMGSAQVVLDSIGPSAVVSKHIGGVTYDDITLVCGTGMSRAFYEWIDRSVRLDATRMSGAVVSASYDLKELTRLTFTDALISEYTLPALDASSKDPAHIIVKLQPEQTRTKFATGKDAIGGAIDERKQKRWLVSNFRLDIDGLADACKWVGKIDALSVKQKTVIQGTGDERSVQREPATLEYSHLVVTLAEVHAEPFYKWFEHFVLEGNSGAESEKQGTLEFLASNLKDVLFTVTFDQLGVFKLSVDKLEAGTDQIRRVKVEMYCEKMHFKYGDSTWA